MDLRVARKFRPNAQDWRAHVCVCVHSERWVPLWTALNIRLIVNEILLQRKHISLFFQNKGKCNKPITFYFTMKPVCNDHLSNKMYYCDLFSNVF